MVFYMNGKVLKVVEYNLSFGNQARMVNVFGCFKYKPTNNLYIIYADVDTKYNIVYYGSSHVKETSILSMECRDKKEEEVIKEYIFKVTQKEELSDFEIISLDKIEGVEIISSNRLEVKPEVLASLVDLTIPKPVVEEKPLKKDTPKKKKSKKILMILLGIILLVFVGVIYFTTLTPKDKISKTILCTKTSNHDTLNATLTEESIYQFDYHDTLSSVDTTETYQFLDEEDYQDFINKGIYYRYMPDDNTEGGWDKDDLKHTFKIIIKERIDSGYDKPINYEDVLASSKKEGYQCEENIVKE